jgi:hypothetical protein
MLLTSCIVNPLQDLVPTRARIALKDEAQSTTYNILSITESLCHAPHFMHCEPTTGLGAHARSHSLEGWSTPGGTGRRNQPGGLAGSTAWCVLLLLFITNLDVCVRDKGSIGRRHWPGRFTGIATWRVL